MPIRDSRWDARRRWKSTYYAVTTRIPRHKELDTVRLLDIIRFTLLWIIFRGAHARERSQTGSPAAARNVEPAARQSQRCTVCQRQLFRFQGSGPGQVRNAS